MADNQTPEEIFQQIAEMARNAFLENEDDPLVRVEAVYHLWRCWANFELRIVSPEIAAINPVKLHHPAQLDNGDYEFVYTIHDGGNWMSTSKAEDMMTSGMSMCKLYYTIEKMIFLLIERLKSGGISDETEVQVSFGGHELAQRKAFESIINLRQNVVVSNFDPDAWGERFLNLVKNLADKGYGFPPESPRDIYRIKGVSSGGMKRF